MNPAKLMRLPVTELLGEAEPFKSSDPVSKVVGYLQSSDVKEALVDDGDSRSWSVSVRDLLNVTTLGTKLSSVMSQVPRLGPTNTVGDAAALMREYRTRSLPVFEKKKLSGRITSPSIVAKLLDSDTPGRVSAIMTPSPIVVEDRDSVAKGREKMLKHRIDQLPVTKSGALFGIVTAEEMVFNLMPKTDRMSRGDASGGRYDELLAVFADRDVLTNEITDSLRDVFRRISKAGTNYSVIVGTGEIQGIVTYRDFLTVLVKRATASSVPLYMVGLPDDPFEAESARAKFQGAVEILARSMPDVSEARAVIRVGETKSPKKRYEVQVFLIHPRQHYSYSVKSYALADAFDEVSDWVKGLVNRSKPRKERRGSNARAFPQDFHPESAPG